MSKLQTMQTEALKLKKGEKLLKKVLASAVKNMYNPSNGIQLGLTLNPDVTTIKSGFEDSNGVHVNLGMLFKEEKQLPIGLNLRTNKDGTKSIEILGDFWGNTTDEKKTAISYADALGQMYQCKKIKKAAQDSEKYTGIKESTIKTENGTFAQKLKIGIA